jgi:hypothetical protein
LAYGYEANPINEDLIEFSFVCHPMKFYIRRNIQNSYEVITTFNDGRYHVLRNIYVYAEEFGAFPNVKFVEFFGNGTIEDSTTYFKMVIND